MDFTISNIKISLLFKSGCTIKHFIQKAENRRVKCVMQGNFIVIKDIFPITIFKKMSEKYHVSITGIPSFKDVEEAISWLINVYCSVESFILIKKEIDNLTATYNTGYKIR